MSMGKQQAQKGVPQRSPSLSRSPCARGPGGMPGMIMDVQRLAGNHGSISAEIIRPYVRDDVYQAIKNHQDFQGKHYYHHFGVATNLRDQFKDESWFDLCAEFTDDWDQGDE
jgi:hypothetical protein